MNYVTDHCAIASQERLFYRIEEKTNSFFVGDEIKPYFRDVIPILMSYQNVCDENQNRE
ncbi:hypothetical protein F070042J6_22920 [Bacteroides sp. f07]